MPVTLERLIRTIESIDVKTESEFADQWLGVFEGVIPKEMTSTEYIKMLRETCYAGCPKSPKN
ncbi:MAG: hypothetical protein K8R25_02180 [Methanosarcinales archaeon]|nr:hypothetical protein [Methanosarcinales archaeon]